MGISTLLSDHDLDKKQLNMVDGVSPTTLLESFRTVVDNKL